MDRWQLRQAQQSRRPQMRKTFVTITALALVPLGAVGCVSKSEYTKTVQAAEAHYNALDAEHTRLKHELAGAGKRNEQLTVESGELDKSITDLRQRISAHEGDNARLKQELAEAQKAREDKVREVSSTYEQLVAKMKGEIDKGQVTISELKGKLTVNMVEAILFDSGKAEVKPEGLVVLGTIPPLARPDVRGDADTRIRVDGSNTSGLSFTRVGIDGGTLRSTATGLEVWTSTSALALALQGRGAYFPGSVQVDGNISAKYQDVTEWVPGPALPAGAGGVAPGSKPLA